MVASHVTNRPGVRVGCCRYVDTRAEKGMTALHMAALTGTLLCVQILLEAGASMMVRTIPLTSPSSMLRTSLHICTGEHFKFASEVTQIGNAGNL